MFQSRYELARFQQAVMRARVQPSVATLHDLHVELATLQIGLVDGGDFQLATGAGFDGLGNVNDLVVVKVQTCHGVAAFGHSRFFFNAGRSSFSIKSHHAIAFWILYMVGKHRCTGGVVVCAR